MNEHDGGEQVDDIQNPMPVLRISPEPTEEELAVITGAVMALSRSWQARVEGVSPPEDRWRMAGRREALRSPLQRQVVVPG